MKSIKLITQKNCKHCVTLKTVLDENSIQYDQVSIEELDPVERKKIMVLVKCNNIKTTPILIVTCDEWSRVIEYMTTPIEEILKICR